MPINLCGGNKAKKANYLLSGHWSEKARREAARYITPNIVWEDPEDTYLSIDGPEKWSVDKDATYFHYTSADTRQGLEFQNFPYHAVPKD